PGGRGQRDRVAGSGGDGVPARVPLVGKDGDPGERDRDAGDAPRRQVLAGPEVGDQRGEHRDGGDDQRDVRRRGQARGPQEQHLVGERAGQGERQRSPQVGERGQGGGPRTTPGRGQEDEGGGHRADEGDADGVGGGRDRVSGDEVQREDEGHRRDRQQALRAL